jgi:hypothetical protein
MAFDIRLPVINAQTEKGQLEQMRSYLYQFAEQLKYAVNILNDNSTEIQQHLQTAVGAIDSPTDKQREKQFANLKHLIISSADIVDAYTEKITSVLEGRYEALSPEFGTFIEDTKRFREETSEAVTDYYTNKQQIGEWKQQTEAYIKTGKLGYDENEQPIFGVEIGQTDTDEDGNATYIGMSRFTSNRVTFFDSNGNEQALLSNRELIIDGIVCRGNLYIGKFVVGGLNGFTIKPSRRQVT